MDFKTVAGWVNQRNPLWLLLAMGTVLYAFYAWQNPAAQDQYEIRLTSSDIDQIEGQLGQRLQRSPGDEELRLGIAQHIENEALYREALMLELHLGDQVVRRRLIQIMTFLQEDTSETEPGDDELRAYFDSHLDDYRQPARLTLRQLFFSTDRRADAKNDAIMALSELRAGTTEPPVDSDPFVTGSRFTGISGNALEGEFGNDFATQVMRSPVGDWHGPIRSAFGWHLVFIDEKQEPRLLSFDEVRAEVKRSWRLDARERRTRDRIQRLASKYRVTIDGHPWTNGT